MADEPSEAPDDREPEGDAASDVRPSVEPSEPEGEAPSLDAMASPEPADPSPVHDPVPDFEASSDDDAPQGDDGGAGFGSMRGVELTPEELDAIREATRATATPGAVLIVSRPEDREQWSIDLDGAGLDLAFVSDTHQLLVALRERDVESVIVDADACSAGGLPALAVLRNRGERLAQRIVVASRPTRTHVVSCLAAGATGYLARPLALEQLLEQLRG